jgi:hypothetical protein
MVAFRPAFQRHPLIIMILRLHLLAASVALIFSAAPAALAQTTSFNSGSLGAAGDATNSAGVTLNLTGPLAAPGDFAVGYSGGARTTLAYNPALNPASNLPFTIEFWAKPFAITDDAVGPAPVFDRVSSSPRSGWVFFQRSPTSGWNFRMYDGNGSNVGFDLTGGTNAQNVWNQIVVTWNGSSSLLYVDGTLADNTSTGSGVYNASTAATLSLGSYDDGSNPFNGSVDEFAFYQTALSAVQIANHYTLAASPTPNAYRNAVVSDGAVEYLQNVPEPSTALLLGAGVVSGVCRRRQRRRA